ncbi:response regulator [Nanoarchaeota archaeon]
MKKMLKTVMVVDDEEHNRVTVQNILESNGYNVVTAVDGDDCLKKLKKMKPALILMDVMMPGTPVSVVVREIPEIKVAYFTVMRASDAQKSVLTSAENVVGFIQKPFHLNTFIKKIKKLVG